MPHVCHDRRAADVGRIGDLGLDTQLIGEGSRGHPAIRRDGEHPVHLSEAEAGIVQCLVGGFRHDLGDAVSRVPANARRCRTYDGHLPRKMPLSHWAPLPRKMPLGHWAPSALRAFPPSGSEPSFGRPCGGLIGVPSRCALRYSPLGRPGGLMRRGFAHGTGEWRCPRAPLRTGLPLSFQYARLRAACRRYCS